MAFNFIPEALTQRLEQSLFRQRQPIEVSTGTLIKVDGQHYINFASNDYLGMRQSMEVMQAWVDGISEFGGGSGASPLVTGYTQAHHALETYLAEALGREQVLLFNSGFAANQAICQALFNESNGPTGSIVADKLIHASLIDGAQASSAHFLRYRHNDLNHLQQQLCKTSGDTLVVTEGVFSMDGDAAPVHNMLPIVDAHQAWLMLDDAHGFGVLGTTGMGSAEALALSQQQLPVLMATFGKAIGTAGAFVAGSRELIDY
ncbi:MAG: 8-amino-7-oxononanoate synthase, partial [Paraglaciecola sp.]